MEDKIKINDKTEWFAKELCLALLHDKFMEEFAIECEDKDNEWYMWKESNSPQKVWDWVEPKLKVIPMDAVVKPACGYCKDCKFWKEENLECKNDIIWLNKDKNVFFNISDLKTNTFFGCVRFESKSV